MRIKRWGSITAFLVIAGIELSAALAQAPRQPENHQEVPQEEIVKPRSVQTEVSFESEDGWKIYGTYTVPLTAKPGERLPAALLLHSTMHTQMVWVVYPGWVKAQESLVTLRIDWRGRGKSRGRLPFEEFTPAQREQVAMDVKAALDFLAARQEVDPSRIGVVAEDFSTGAALKGALADTRARAFVLISGSLDQPALDLVAAHTDKAILYIVSKEDRRGFDSLTRAYDVTKRVGNTESEIWVQDGLGIGLAMNSVWRNRYPDRPEEGAPDFTAAEWLVSKLRGFGQFTEIMLPTEDGWRLHAKLGLPAGAKDGKPVPAVILLPTALSDSASYYDLERVLVSQGLATLNLEWRGIGRSINKGALVDLPLSEMPKALHDVEVGFRFLSSTTGIDPNRIGILGSAYGAKLAMTAAQRISGLKAVALLTPVVKPHQLNDERAAIKAINRPVLLVTGDGFGAATKEFAAIAAQPARNTVLTYEGGILGHALLRVDPALEPTIARWFKQRLAPPVSESPMKANKP
jgi:dienelactone hydrolase